MSGTLYLISIPIGNEEDISHRAITTLKNSDVVVCEELKVGRRFLNGLNIKKPLRPLNEHNEVEQTDIILEELKKGKRIVLISDAGSPLLSDPGTLLVQRCIDLEINITSVPGANALIPALQLSGFSNKSFIFDCLLSPKKEVRRKELLRYKNESRTVILYEAPYRLLPLLRDMLRVLGYNRRAAVLFDLTTPDEKAYRGTLKELTDHFNKFPRKGEFVVLIEGKG